MSRFADQGRTGILSRGGPALAVFAAHVVALYALSVSMGIVEMPKFNAPIEAVFIEDMPAAEPEPEVNIKPEIESPVTVDEPPPEVQFETPVTPVAEVAVPESASAISATPSAGAVSKELKTSSRVEPIYPPASRRAGEEGTVRVKVLVDERGRPSQVQVAQSSGFPKLDEAAVTAVRKWKFQAATDGTRPVQAWTQVAVTFKLTNANA
jgi:periplasmic protein TonB